ncbi:MAG: sigma-54 dependent transcriptional regulator [Polyangiales bacterium]
MARHRVLIAKDDHERARALASALAEAGCACEIVRTGAAAVAAVTRRACDVVITDVRFGSGSELDLLVRLHLLDKAVPVIILTARGSVDGAVTAIKHGAYQYLVEPCSADEIHRHVCAAGARSQPLLSSSAPLGQLVQSSASMKDLARSIALVARSSAPVLIVGESGTGKELVAHAIHERGPRAARPFLAINTTALPEHLLESELFGHVRGAYTGALHARAGLFAEADGGTLLLDEIGDMPRALQPKLLRVLQSGVLRPVGSDHERRVDVRIIAATHRDLARSVADSEFRADLLYRLNALILYVPPLRERPEDIASLAPQLLAAARARNPESPVRALADDVMLDLQGRGWPGNVRELQSAIERMVTFGMEEVVSMDQLVALAPATPSAVEAAWYQPDGSPATIRQMSERYVAWTLTQTRGDKARAAARLGIDISTLYRKQRGRPE